MAKKELERNWMKKFYYTLIIVMILVISTSPILQVYAEAEQTGQTQKKGALLESEPLEMSLDLETPKTKEKSDQSQTRLGTLSAANIQPVTPSVKGKLKEF